MQSRIQPLSPGLREEGGQFLGGPGPGDSAGLATVAGIGRLRNVRVDQLAAHGEVKGGSDQDVHFVNGLGGQALAVLPASGGKLVVEPFEMVDPQASEWDVTDSGVDVSVNKPRVPIGRCGPDMTTLHRQPGVGEELAEMRRPAAGWGGAGVVSLESLSHLLGVVTVIAGGMPPAPFSPSEWVDAVIGDDVEAVLALDDVCDPGSLTTS